MMTTNIQGNQALSKRHNVEKIPEVIHKARHQIIHELTDTIRISCGVCQEILTENFNMHCIAAKSVLQLLKMIKSRGT
jgi:hypothetical protein